MAGDCKELLEQEISCGVSTFGGKRKNKQSLKKKVLSNQKVHLDSYLITVDILTQQCRLLRGTISETMTELNSQLLTYSARRYLLFSP